MNSVILYGHRVLREAVSGPGADGSDALTPAGLERLLAAIATHRPDAGWLARLASGQPAQPGCVLLTFDDGYADIYTEALPLLEQYRVPCVIFITTGFADRELEAYETLLATLLAGRRELVCPNEGPLALADDSARSAVYRRLRLWLRPQGRRGRQRYMDALRQLNPAAPAAADGGYLDWARIRELDRHPLVTVGAHGRSHILLSRPHPLEVYGELRHSRSRLERELGRRVDLVAYPYGANTALTRLLARRAGYRLGFGTQPGTLAGNRNRMALPRMPIAGYLDGLQEPA